MTRENPQEDAAVEFLNLLAFCSRRGLDTLLKIESEGGDEWEFDARQFLLCVRADYLTAEVGNG